LRDIHSDFTEPGLSPQTPDAHPQPKRTLRFPPMHLSFHRRRQNPGHIADSGYRWEFNFSEVVNRCKFSPDGNHLAIVSNKKIAVESTADIQHDPPGITREFQHEKSWGDFFLGSKYLCVAVDSDYFEVIKEPSKVPMQSYDKMQCSFFTFSTGTNPDISHIEKKPESPIRSVALSPNDELVAFLHEYDRQGRKTLRVTLYQTQDMIGKPTSWYESRTGPQKFQSDPR